MKTLLLTAVALFVCSCYQGSEAAGAGEESPLIDCEQGCDVEALCADWVDPGAEYSICLDDCDYVNAQSLEGGVTEDTKCVDLCYAAAAGALDCNTFSSCIFNCDPWWAQG